MNGLMIFGIIFSSVLAFVFILLCFPATIYLEKHQDKEFIFKIKYLFIKIDNQNKKESKKEKKATDKKEESDKASFFDKLSYYLKLTKKGLNEAGFILSHTKISNLYLKLICGGADAAFIAVSYGALCSMVYPILGILENKTKVQNGAFDLNIKADYNKKDWEYGFNITLRLSLIFAIIGGIRFYIFYKKETK